MSEEPKTAKFEFPVLILFIIGGLVFVVAGANVNGQMPLMPSGDYNYVSPEELRGE